MLELSIDQETEIARNRCRGWIKQMAQEWYSADNTDGLHYPEDQFISHLKAVYETAMNANINDVQDISMLGFNVLRANQQNWNSQSVKNMVIFFIAHANKGNADYAQNWIDIQLEEGDD
jgi:hypothetical protein